MADTTAGEIGAGGIGAGAIGAGAGPAGANIVDLPVGGRPGGGESAAHAPAESRLAHFPVSFFAVVMGTGGLSLATHKLERLLDAGPRASLVIGGIAGAAFLVIGLLYLAKALRHPRAVIAEWHHPVRLSFFPTISISLLVLSLVALPVSRDAAEPLWIAGTVMQVVFSLAVLSAWIGHREFQPPHLNPAWFIPAVGNIIVPVAGVPLGYVEPSWFFFSFGLLFWLVLLTLVFNRLIFHTPLPERLLPTLTILIAPPAIGFLAWLGLSGHGIDAFAHILFYAGLALFLLVATQAGRMVRIKFALSWWAYSFPLAALTTAAAVFADAIGGRTITGIFFALYALLAVVLTVLVIATVRAIFAGAICRPE